VRPGGGAQADNRHQQPQTGGDRRPAAGRHRFSSGRCFQVWHRAFKDFKHCLHDLISTKGRSLTAVVRPTARPPNPGNPPLRPIPPGKILPINKNKPDTTRANTATTGVFKNPPDKSSEIKGIRGD
jgi:hypothetical protein